MAQAVARQQHYSNRERNYRRKKRRQMLRIKKFICLLLFIIIFILMKELVKSEIFHKSDILSTIIDSSFTDQMKDSKYGMVTPVKRSDEEVLYKLKDLADQYPEFNTIYVNQDEYPVKLLSALVNNPEMIEFALDYPDNKGAVEGGLTLKEKSSDHPLFLQWDKRWGYAPYGGSDIGLSGCGPTCLSMVAYSLTKNSDYTPDAVSKFAADNGYYVEDTGTSWSLMTNGASNFNIRGTEISLNQDQMKAQLDEGHPIICIMGPGDFTASGHFIMLYDYDENGFYVNDPNSKTRSSRQWTFDEIDYQIRSLWSYQKSK